MLNLIIFGSPGAGKGTQASLISKKYKLEHLSSGEILRQGSENKKIEEKIKKYQKAGNLVPDSLIIAIVEKKIIEKMNLIGFIFDGYPRTLNQAKKLDQFLSEYQQSINLVINLELDEKEASRRIMLRSKTSQRTDDNLKTIKNRFEVYRNKTTPLLKYYQKQEKLININGELSIEKVFSEINKNIKNYKSGLK